MQLTFIYFDFPFWRAEVSKIALFLADIDFENKIITREAFQNVKDHGKLDDGTVIPFHQLPCLLVDGAPIAQTGAIARFCGKLSGLYPTNDNFSAAYTDQLIDFATDITVLVSNTGRDDNDEVKRLKRQNLHKGELARKLNMLEKNLSSSKDWIVGNNIGLADIAVWRLMGWLSSGVIDGLPVEILNEYPKINRICLSVDKHYKIQEWVKLTYPKNYVRGNYLPT
mgnify:CR=1 FL=1|tara:strand:+ start:89 stop:763 length:675 start_codon:yes stop_codon:yes gene_type:complete